MNELLQAITKSDCKASKGKFRAVVLINLEIHRIGDDSDDFTIARKLVELQPEESFIQIYDDKGEALLPEGTRRRMI